MRCSQPSELKDIYPAFARTRLVELPRVPVSLRERAQARVVVINQLLEVVGRVVWWNLGAVAIDDGAYVREIDLLDELHARNVGTDFAIAHDGRRDRSEEWQ